jgi:hypothetical protein
MTNLAMNQSMDRAFAEGSWRLRRDLDGLQRANEQAECVTVAGVSWRHLHAIGSSPESWVCDLPGIAVRVYPVGDGRWTHSEPAHQIHWHAPDRESAMADAASSVRSLVDAHLGQLDAQAAALRAWRERA